MGIVGVPMRPAMVVPTPVFVPTRQMAPVYIQPNMDDDEPASKRQRTEENLIPEGEFLARNLSPVTFKVMVPQMPDKPEWKLDGQILSLTFNSRIQSTLSSNGSWKSLGCLKESRNSNMRIYFSRMPIAWHITMLRPEPC